MADMPIPFVRLLTLWIIFVSLLTVGLGVTVRQVQAQALDDPPGVGPFLDGALPKMTPQPDGSGSSGGSGWKVVDAFPNLKLPQTLMIASNPSDNRLYVGSRKGVIVSFENDESVAVSKPFMDLSDRVALVWEGGVFGLAFHPEFGKQGSDYKTTFYVYYSSHCPTRLGGKRHTVNFSKCNRGYPTKPAKGFFNTWLRLSRFEAYRDAKAGVWRGDPGSEMPLFNIRLYNSGHRGGGLIFGNDGHLYVAIGDQQRAQNAQDIVNSFEGGVMRMAVDITENGNGSWSCPAGSRAPIRRMPETTGNPDEITGQLYCIPNSNPWPGLKGQNYGEYYSIGLRNPFRISVDRNTGRVWVGDVGGNKREEINIILKGRNYQWPFREGKIAGSRAKPKKVVGTEQPPVIDFVRNEARAIIGGYVYRGSLFPDLYGRYIVGDYVTDRIWAVTLNADTMKATKKELTRFPSGSLGTFGQDGDGEILMGDVFKRMPLQRLSPVGGKVAVDAPAWLSDTGALVDTADFVVSPAAVPYDPVPFWSDGAYKQRWLFLPNDGTHNTASERIRFSERGNWGFPKGTVAMKHFELPLNDARPSDRIRLETRLMVKGNDGKVYGLTYRWRKDQRDAYLLKKAETATYTIKKEGGGTRKQKWLYPSRSDCLQCHTQAAGGFLALRTHQLNRKMTYPSTGRRENQLKAWNARNMFHERLRDWEIDQFLAAATLDQAGASLELRARSWLDSNCSYCHRPETGNRASFDARLTTPLAKQGMIWGAVSDDLGIADAYIIHPGDPLSSVLYHRAEVAAKPSIMMPPLAKELPHEEALDVLWAWIYDMDPDAVGGGGNGGGVAPSPGNGVNFEYYEVGKLKTLPDFDKLTPSRTGTTSTFSIAQAGHRSNRFAFRFRSTIWIPEDGSWTFYTSSDDGSRLFIDGKLLVNNDGLHGVKEKRGTRKLSKGYHTIEVTMFEASGGEVLVASLSGPGLVKQPIPARMLYSPGK